MSNAKKPIVEKALEVAWSTSLTGDPFVLLRHARASLTVLADEIERLQAVVKAKKENEP